MSSGNHGTVLRQVHRLFGAGTVAGMAEGQLLERFAAGRDEVAFGAIVARHGPMVLGVCRRLLREPHDVEDAFQATFLVLVKKAGLLRDRDALGPWLYGVASRVARRARVVSARRQGRERGAVDVEIIPMRPAPDAIELRDALDEEINRLPEKFRRPIVLCHLEGRTQEEAALELQWTPGMVRGRLARGRERLRGRLARRGLAPAALAGFWVGPEAGAAVPPALAEAAVRAATIGGVSRSVIVLAEGVRRAMFLSRLKSIAGGLLALGAVVLAAVAGRSPIEGQARAVGQDGPPRAETPAKAAEATKKEEPATARRSRGRMEPKMQKITVVGQARDREGKPVAGATIFVTDANGRRAGGSPLVLRETTTFPTGLFILDVFPLPVWPPDPGPIPKPTEGKFEVAGWAPGYGFAWDKVRRFAPDPDDPAKSRDPVIEINLVFGPPARLRGRVTDDLGKPIAGAKVQVGYIDDPRRPEGGGMWRCEAIDPEGGEPRPFNGVQAIPESIRSTRTDERGEYHLDGLPREAQFLTLIDADPAVEPETSTIATTERPIKGARTVGHDGTFNPTVVMPRKVMVRLHSLHGAPRGNVTIRAQGERMQRAGAILKAKGGPRDVLDLPPGAYTLTVEPAIDSPWLPAERSIVVEKTPPRQMVEITVESGARVRLEAIDAETGAGIAGVGFEYVTDTSRKRHEVQSSPSFVDHPKTNAEGRLSVVMAPGNRRFFVARFPDRFEPKDRQSQMLILNASGPNTVRFAFQPKPKKTSGAPAELSGPDGELRKRLNASWRRQQEKASRAYFVARRTWQPADGVTLDDLRRLLDSLDPDATPKLAERIAKTFPEAAPATETRFEVSVDEPRRREVQRPSIQAEGRPYNDVTVFNGKEEVRYNSANAQADIYARSWINITGLNDFAHWPHVSDDSEAGVRPDVPPQSPKITRAGNRATIEWDYGSYVSRMVVDETTGFIYQDSLLQKDGQGQETWQFDPRTYPNGVSLASVSVEVHSAKDGINSIFIRSLDAVAFDTPMSPGTFLVEAPAGTMILDHRDEEAARASGRSGARNDAYRGVLRGPIGDVVAYADRVAAKRQPPEPPRFQVGDQAPPLDPAAWLDRDGQAAPPDLKGKVVLIDFWGITCGPCVAELPDVREAAEHFDKAGLVIVGLHDSSGTVPEVAGFAGKRHLSYPIAIDRPDAKSNGFGATFEDYGVRSIPGAAVLDRQGRIAYVGRFKEALARAAELLEIRAK